MKALINHQSIRIDNHRRGTGQPSNWDDASADIHVDKRTNRRFGGKQVKVIIKLPINSDSEPTFEIRNSPNQSFKRTLTKEINDALRDKEKRNRFTKELVDIIKNYNSVMSEREKAQLAVKRIARALDLEDEIFREMRTYINDELLSFTTIHREGARFYFISLEQAQIRVGELDGPFVLRFIYRITRPGTT